MTEKVKVLVLSVLIVLFCSPAFAQSHFIFIQSENKQPFNVILNTKTYGSSGSGYVIIPQLNSGEHFAEVRSVSTQQSLGKFRVVINYNDLGFTLKQQNTVWVLENVQSGEILSEWKEKAEEKKPVTNGAGFGDILSQVVSDPNLNKKKEEKQSQSDTAAVQTVTAAVKNDEADNDTLPESNTSGVIKNSEEETKAGLNLVFVDFNSKRNDTVSIVIPLDGSVITDSSGHELNTATAVVQQPQTKEPEKADSVVSKIETSTDAGNTKTTDSSLAVVPAKTIIQEKDSVLPQKKQETLTLSTTPPVVNNEMPVKDSVSNPFHQPESLKQGTDSSLREKKSIDPLINPNCKAIAANEDFLKLRKKMASQDTEDQMLEAARKAFRLKCYTTEQIKNLGSLFLNDQSRYAFLDAAYSYVFDPGNYSTLESELIDDYYKKRFRAMLH